MAIDTPTISCIAAGAIPANSRVKFTRNPAEVREVALCGVGENHDGVAIIDANAAGNGITVALKNKPGTFDVIAADTFAAGAILYGAADGKVSSTPSGQPQFLALAAGVANGQISALPLNTTGGGSNVCQQIIPIEDLAAGGDIAARPVFVVPDRGVTLIAAGIITEGEPAGVDDSNTAVFALADADDNAIVSKTYDTANQPPTSSYGDLGSLDATHKSLAAGEVVKLSVTQGTTANLPSAKLVLVYA